MKYKKRREQQRSWYKNEEAVKRVKKEAHIKDLYSEINSNMRTEDLLDFEKYMMFMLSCNNCNYSMINLSYCRIKFQLIERHKNRFNNIYKIEIIDKYIATSYILQTIRFKDLYDMIHKVIKTLETNTSVNWWKN